MYFETIIIFLIYDFQFTSNTTVPEQICSKCLDDLNIAFRFYMNCENTEAVLKSITENLMSDDQEDIECDEDFNSPIKVKDEPEFPESNVTNENYEEEIEFLDNMTYVDSESETTVSESIKLKVRFC